MVTVYRKFSFKARVLVEKNRCLLSIFDKCRSYLHLQTTFASPYSKSDTLVVRRKELSCSVSQIFFFFGGGGGGGGGDSPKTTYEYECGFIPFRFDL